MHIRYRHLFYSLLIFLSGCAIRQEHAVPYENTVNYAASFPDRIVRITGKVIGGNPAKGLETVYVLEDDTGRPVEMRSRAAMPEMGSRVQVEGHALKARAYSGDMMVFQVTRQVVSAPPNLLQSLIGVVAVVAVVTVLMILMVLGAMRRNGHTALFTAGQGGGTAVFGINGITIQDYGATLEVEAGLSNVSSIPLPKYERIVFGRSPRNAPVLVRIDNAYLSANHGEFLFDASQQSWSLQVGVATNSTLLNGRQLQPGEIAVLTENDRIQVGELILIFHPMLDTAVTIPSNGRGVL